ncbi:VC0807 family protein [Nocardia brasiliensis]|uniref:VC0807 family protein n=1 Tax=Nocardia brasiliensis TaxID=37326 RepID=UPI0033E7274C
MRVQVDRNMCIGSGNCALTAAAVFDQDDDTGLVRLVAQRPAAGYRLAVEHAVARCPAGAITVLDDERASPAKTSGVLVAKTVVVDVGVPYAAYLALTLAGVSDVVALVAAGGVSALRVVVGYLRHRRVSALSVLVLSRFVLGVLAGLLTGNATVVLLKDPIITAVMGAVILVSLALWKPLTYYIRRDFVPDGLSWDEAWRQSRAFRRQHRTVAAVWGVGLIAESLVRVALVLTSPVQVAAVASPLVGTGCILLLFAWMNWHVRVGEPRKSQAPADR